MSSNYLIIASLVFLVAIGHVYVTGQFRTTQNLQPFQGKLFDHTNILPLHFNNHHNTTNHDLVSLRAVDGQHSIEHLISIHVQDLFDIGNQTQFTLGEVLAGLRYLMLYRIQGNKMPNLNLQIMQRLCDSLLLNMTHKATKSIIHGKRLSVESNEAFCLFVEFMLEVVEFRDAICLKPVADLRHQFKLHQRIKSGNNELCTLVSQLLHYLPKLAPQFNDWHDLGFEQYHDEIDQFMKNHPVVNAVHLRIPQSKLYPPPDLYFDRTVKKILYMFKTDLESGLASSTIPSLTQHYGTNELPPPPKPSALKMLWAQITDFMVMILIAVSILKFATNDPDPAYVILVVVGMNVVIGFTQEYKANKALEALSSLTVPRAKVIRDAQVQELDACELVPGDLVVLEEGDMVPADLRIVESAQLEIVEALLTGEPIGILKSGHAIKSTSRRMPLGDCKGNAFMSTLVSKGRGKGIVVRTGLRTEVGKIASAITAQPHATTHIQKKLDLLGKLLVVASFLLCALVVVIGVAYGRLVLQMIKVGISLAVSVIPEGLVAVVTVTMAIGVRRMASQNAIVRKLPSVETLGSVTVICSDKTGTLTQGKMGTEQIWTVDRLQYAISDSTNMNPNIGTLYAVSSDQTRTAVGRDQVPMILQLTFGAATLCNNASVVQLETGEFKVVGDSTEVAMIVAAQKLGLGQDYWTQEGWTRVGENAFDSERKVMSVAYQYNGQGVVFAKGAPENVLARCTGLIETYTGQAAFTSKPRSDLVDQQIADAAASMAGQGLRVLGLAVRHYTIGAVHVNDLEVEWIFVGLLGLIDPPRQGVKDAVSVCKNAGINVIMITGDHIATASAIAKQLGILEPDNPNRSRAIRGAELDLLSEDQIAALSPFPNVFARVSPDNKFKIVQALQRAGQLAAMTGDGVNDAPALKAADVGVAMGIAGTEITKQAADVVLADDNFATITKAVAEGRRVYDNIQKFIIYLLSCNSAEIWVMLACAVINRDLPFTTMVILYANIIADVPPAMAIGIEEPEADIMNRPPRDPKSKVLDMKSAVSILVQGLSMSAITLFVYLLRIPSDVRVDVDPSGNETYVPAEILAARSEAFAVLTTIQLFQGFISRSTHQSLLTIGLIGNKWMIVGVLFSFIGLLIGFYVPPFAAWLGLVPLDGIMWAKVLAGLVVHVVVTELLKFGIRLLTTTTRSSPVVLGDPTKDSALVPINDYEVGSRPASDTSSSGDDLHGGASPGFIKTAVSVVPQSDPTQQLSNTSTTSPGVSHTPHQPGVGNPGPETNSPSSPKLINE